MAGSGQSAHGSFRPIADIRNIGTEDEDSDRPVWAGGGGGPNDRGGKPADAGSARGDLYGDMYVILRDDNGVPILTPEGFVQPIDANGNPIPLDAEGLRSTPASQSRLSSAVSTSAARRHRFSTGVQLK